MVVRRIIEGIPRPFLTSPAKKMLEFQHDSLYQGGGALSLLVAAGPYTTTDSLEYEPLEDLLKVSSTTPDPLLAWEALGVCVSLRNGAAPRRNAVPKPLVSPWNLPSSKVIAARQPDVAVLCGPFVDANHPQVRQDGAWIVEGGERARREGRGGGAGSHWVPLAGRDYPNPNPKRETGRGGRHREGMLPRHPLTSPSPPSLPPSLPGGVG
jgi:hypothetical protein